MISIEDTYKETANSVYSKKQKAAGSMGGANTQQQ